MSEKYLTFVTAPNIVRMSFLVSKINTSILVSTYLLCFCFTLFAKDADKTKPEALPGYVLSKEEETKFPEGQARSEYIAGRDAYNNKEYEESANLLEKSANLCKVKRYPEGEMICYYHISRCYRRIADYSNYQKYLSLLMESAGKLTNKQYLSYAYEGFGNLYRYIGDYPQSIENYLEAIKISESTGKLSEASTALNNMSIVYEYMGNTKEQLNIQLRNYAILQKLNNKADLAMSLSNLSAIYLQLGQKSKASEYINMAKKIIEEEAEKINFKALAAVYGQYAAVATLEKNYDVALIYYNKGFDLMKVNKDKKGVSEYYGSLANVYVQMGKFVLAEEFFIKQLELSSEIHYLNGCLTACSSLKDMKLKQKDYKAASVYLQEYTQLKDSSESEATKQKIALAEMRFKIKNGQQEQKILEDAKAFQELEQKRKKIIWYAIEAIILLVLIIGFLLYRSYKHKR